MKRSAFLPVFFAGLTAVFGVAVWMRLSAYDATPLNENVQRGAARPVAKGDGRVEARPTSAAADDPGVIEELPGTSTASASARQRRYDELLRGAPPAPAPTSAQPIAPKEASLFDRVINPIANALGMSRAAQRPQQPTQVVAGPPQQAQRPQQQPRNAEESAPPGGDGNKEKEPRDPDDPETDTTPPQLGGAEFIPAQVQDDGETMLSTMVTDNLSGVRSVSGVISSPSGALQGFACQREGESDRWVARIKVPRDAAEGTWAVKYLTLSDHANNSVNLNQNAGALPPGASFRVVSGGSESAAPQLKGVSLERNAMNAGERNTIFVQAEDDKSGVSLVSGVFVSPSKQARIGFGCKPGSGAMWECVVAPPTCLDCGAWHLEQIQVQDKANNMATFRADNPLVQQTVLEITGDKCDSGPPVLTDLSVTPAVVSNSEEAVIVIRAVVSDDACGTASLSGLAIPSGPQGAQRIYFSFDPSPDGQNFTGRIVVPKHAAKGTWAINWIQALDKGHNLKAYSSNDPVISRVTFRVE
ncbi:MAG TPA: hypothetical protein VND45_17220 [Thermoanaerobaculia bacterium]|nr:hypothetical protein [Thermoanaerobaculia bacterium]